MSSLQETFPALYYITYISIARKRAIILNVLFQEYS